VQESTFQRALRFLLIIFAAMTINRWMEYSYFIDSDWYPLKHFIKYEIIQLIFALLLVSPFFFMKKSFRVYQICLIPLWIYFLLEFAHVWLFKGFPNSATYFSIFSTNSNESTEFLNDYLTWQLLLYLLLYALVLFAVGFFSKNLMRQHEKPSKFIFLTIGIIGFAVFGFTKISNRLAPVHFSDNGLIQSFISYGQYLEEKQKFIDVANQHITFEKLTRNQSHSEIETHVIIIGESTSKHHMSLYGYPRKTNPNLSKENLIIFQNTKTPNAHTVPALEKVLTFKNAAHPELNMEKGSLIDLVNQAGYETFWISNQAFSGEHETPISVMASKASHKTYTNAIGAKTTLDGNVLKPYQKALKLNKSKVIFIHLMGTHLSYKERYPAEFEIFSDDFNLANMVWDKTQQDYINAYDNAIAYNDKIVSELILALKDSKDKCTLTYFSDHGDEVYDFRNFHGHSDVLLSKYMYEIPMIFWCNDSYQLEENEKITNLIAHSTHAFNSENLIHLWSDLFDIYTEYYDSALSPLSTNYISISSSKKLPIIKTPTQNNIDFNDKIWCHRVNGIPRLQEAKKHFNGFEIDVQYQKDNWLDVNHPPTESIGLHLDKLITSTETPSEYYYWLDMKNLDPSNSKKAALHLLVISTKVNCTQNIIVESACLECLQAFDSLGFKTAYYLPFLHDMGEKDLYKSLIKIQKELEGFSPSVLSQERDGYALMQKHFPNCNFISWDLQTEVSDVPKTNQARKWTKNNQQLKVLLIRYDSSNHR